MKATLLFESQQLFVTKRGESVGIQMDLYKLPGRGGKFRFSWIAFDANDPLRRVLFDSHPPKGPHFHVNEDQEGVPFKWISLEDSIRLFRKKVREHFGELEEIPNDGDQEL